MIRIAILTSSYPMHDGEPLYAPFLPPLAEALSRAGADVRVITQRRDGPEGPVGAVPVIRFGSARAGRARDLRPRDPRHWPAIWSLLCGATSAVGRAHRRLPIDYLLAAWALPSGLAARAASARWGMSYGVWALGSDIHRYDGTPAGRALLRGILRPARHRFADDPVLADRVARLAGRDCGFLPSTRELPKPSSGRIPPRAAARRVLFVGRLSEEKGPRTLLEAMARPPLANAEALFLGDGPLRKELEETTRTMGLRAHFAGARVDAEVAEALAASDCLAIPSRSGGDSIPLVYSEGLRAGIPMAVSDVSGMGRLHREIDPGAVARPGDAEDLANKIALLLARDGRPTYPEYAVRRFSIESAADRIYSAASEATGAARR